MEDANELEYNFLARPVVAGVATAGLLLLTQGFGDARSFGMNVAAGAGCVWTSDMLAASVFGGTGGMLLSPVLSGGGYALIQRGLFRSEATMVDMFATGASIDIASQWMLNPVGRALGLI